MPHNGISFYTIHTGEIMFPRSKYLAICVGVCSEITAQETAVRANRRSSFSGGIAPLVPRSSQMGSQRRGGGGTMPPRSLGPGRLATSAVGGVRQRGVERAGARTRDLVARQG